MLRVDVYEGGDEAGEGVEETYPNTRKERDISNSYPFPPFFFFQEELPKLPRKISQQKKNKNTMKQNKTHKNILLITHT